MSQMLLSIKPEYVERILSGTKKYEFRKFRCRPDIDTIIIYATSPVKKVIAEATIKSVLEGSPDSVWTHTRYLSGIEEQAYKSYYAKAEKAVAYELGIVTKYDSPKSLGDFGLSYAPQSFAYL